MTGKLLKFHSIGGTTVMYVIVVNCKYFLVIFLAVETHMFSRVHDIVVTD